MVFTVFPTQTTLGSTRVSHQWGCSVCLGQSLGAAGLGALLEDPPSSSCCPGRRCRWAWGRSERCLPCAPYCPSAPPPSSASPSPGSCCCSLLELPAGPQALPQGQSPVCSSGATRSAWGHRRGSRAVVSPSVTPCHSADPRAGLADPALAPALHSSWECAPSHISHPEQKAHGQWGTPGCCSRVAQGFIWGWRTK